MEMVWCEMCKVTDLPLWLVENRRVAPVPRRALREGANNGIQEVLLNGTTHWILKVLKNMGTHTHTHTCENTYMHTHSYDREKYILTHFIYLTDNRCRREDILQSYNKQ